MKSKLGAFAAELRSSASAGIFKQVVASPWWRKARCVALFASRPDEPETEALLEAGWKEGKRILLPKVSAEDLEFYEVADKKGLMPGAFGVLEPDLSHCHHVEPSEIDLILVPGLAFDREGLRLGRGKGFYDRFLARPGVQARTIGLFFALQEVEKVPSEGHDWKLDGVLTEKGLKIVRSAP